MAQTIADTVTACYLCGQPVDGSTSSGDHVIPRTLRGKGPPKIPGFDYGGVLPTHPECNNRFGDETHVRKALQLLGALHDSNTTLIRPAPGNLKGHVLALNEQALAGLGPRDFQFFGIYDARKDSVASFDDPAYYAGKPRSDIRKTVLCTVLSVLTKSAAALLVKRHLDDLPSKWNIVCVPYAGDVTKADFSSFFKETKPFAGDIQVLRKRFAAKSWTTVYVTSTLMVWFFFLMDDDCNLVKDIKERFPREECHQFEGESLMELVGHDWPTVGHSRSGAGMPRNSP